MWVIWAVTLVFLACFAYVRLAPSDVERWHVLVEVKGDRTFRRGVTRRVTLGPGALRKFDAIVRQEPRSYALTGSVEDGMVTYISRTRMVGFPDYTTAWMEDEDLMIFARSRFGRRDFGVNAQRVDRWIAELTAY